MVEYSIMKKWKLFICPIIFASILFFSCASNSTQNTNKSENAGIQIIEEPEIVVPEPTAEEIFLEKISNITIEFTKNPAKTKKNKDFNSAYELFVTDSTSNPVEGFEISLKVPVAKEGTELKYESIKLATDEEGKASFMPEKPAFCANTVVTTYPFISEELKITAEQLTAQTATAPFLVESDIVSKGAILFVFEYNENGKSPKNSYDILSGLRKKGVTLIGNAPISDTEYINASKSKIYKENFEMVGTDFGYLIGGTVKFANPVEKNEDGTYTAHMIAYIYGIEMKTGNVIYEQTTEYTSSGINWNKATESCRDKLTALVVDSIMFGL